MLLNIYMVCENQYFSITTAQRSIIYPTSAYTRLTLHLGIVANWFLLYMFLYTFIAIDKGDYIEFMLYSTK